MPVHFHGKIFQDLFRKGEKILVRALENHIAFVLEDQIFCRLVDLYLDWRICVHRQVIVTDQRIIDTSGKRLVRDRSHAAGLKCLLFQGFEDLRRVHGIAIVEIIDLFPDSVRQEQIIPNILKRGLIGMGRPQHH